MAPNIFDNSRLQGSAQVDRLNFEMATACHQRGLFAQAEQLYDSVIAAQPMNTLALQMLATLRLQKGDNLGAVALFDRVLAINPDMAEAWNNRGIALKGLGDLRGALVSHDRAVQLMPDYFDAISNRGVILGDLQRLDEALIDVDRVLSMRPDLAQLHNNRGVILQDMRRFDDALSSYAHAIALQPNYADAHWNEARCRLLIGDYGLGWEKYEWRWQRPDFSSVRRDFVQPQWHGQTPLEGKVILLHAEQGLGDTLQFVRYVPMVAALGARVVLEVQPILKPLMSCLPNIAAVHVMGERLPDFDCHCPLMGLPLAFGTTVKSIPAGAPYILPAQEKVAAWSRRLGKRSSSDVLRVGLMWSGNPAQKDNHLRSMPLRSMVALEDKGLELYSLQRELGDDEERAIAAAGKVQHFGESMEETAALIANLDLVISVCTSGAHLAGAMGKPLWVLLQYAHDWRWLMDRDDSPWYPGAQLFRQPAPGDWDGVMTRVVSALRDLQAARRADAS